MSNEHLAALHARLTSERARHAADGSPLRAVWIAQIEREIERELGRDTLPEMTDDELLAALDA
jgi:hypothetical protein